MFPINNQYEVKGLQHEYKKYLHGHTHSNTQTYVCPSLALVCELFAMIVDPRRSSNEPGQEADHSAQAAGNRPHLQEARQVSEFTATECDKTPRRRRADR